MSLFLIFFYSCVNLPNQDIFTDQITEGRRQARKNWSGLLVQGVGEGLQDITKIRCHLLISKFYAATVTKESGYMRCLTHDKVDDNNNSNKINHNNGLMGGDCYFSLVNLCHLVFLSFLFSACTNQMVNKVLETVWYVESGVLCFGDFLWGSGVWNVVFGGLLAGNMSLECCVWGLLAGNMSLECCFGGLLAGNMSLECCVWGSFGGEVEFGMSCLGDFWRESIVWNVVGGGL